jgi:hypothetical protein
MVAHDPVYQEAQHALAGFCRRHIAKQISFATNPMDAVQGADALVIVTEWKSVPQSNWAELKMLCMRQWFMTDVTCIVQAMQYYPISYFGVRSVINPNFFEFKVKIMSIFDLYWLALA